jgi:exodeoxyribonuclease VII large subunit
MHTTNEQPQILSVSELNHQAKSLLEGHFPSLWVEGELTNLACPASGHWYFSLKDAQAQVRCAMFRGFNRLLTFTPEAGMKVTARAKVSLYEGRGDFQLIVDFMEEAGFGALQRAFEALKKKLAQEGLFDAAHKKTIPSLPHCIGVITSATGAAVRDILSTLQRRFASIPVIIYPSAVQGKEAAAQLCHAIETANRRQECDVLILARGGGSLEDLWPFNEESVARAIFASHIPIVSGVGHEIDVTIADFIADQRAATPTAAAELCCPSSAHWLSQLQAIQQRLIQPIRNCLAQQQQRLLWLQKRLKHPGQRLQEWMQRLDMTEQRLQRSMQHYFTQQQHRLQQSQQRLYQQNPLSAIHQHERTLQARYQQLTQVMQQALAQRRQQLIQLASSLDAMSPLATLGRGYALVTRVRDGQLLRCAQDIAVGEQVKTHLHEGTLICEVQRIE